MKKIAMKTKQEIEERIAEVEKSKLHYESQAVTYEVERMVKATMIVQCEVEIRALKWVLNAQP